LLLFFPPSFCFSFCHFTCQHKKKKEKKWKKKEKKWKKKEKKVSRNSREKKIVGMTERNFTWKENGRRKQPPERASGRREN
jgi:hypothetical protein